MQRPMTDHGRPTDALVVFAKAPVPGQVKTRLARSLGDAAAARLAEAFLLDILQRAASPANRVLVVAFSPPASEPWFRAHAGPGHLAPQPAAGFGARVAGALAGARQLGAERTVIVGMDSPHLGPDRWDAAFAALDEHDVCLGPCEDGGYYLIGTRAPQPGLFEQIPWGGPGVLRATRDRATALGLSMAELEEDFDVDEMEDLRRLAARLQRDPSDCPRTLEALRSVDLG